MNNLKIVDKSSIMGISLPHKIFINGVFLGILKQKSVTIEDVPIGIYDIKIQSALPFISSQSVIEVSVGENVVEFSDREKIWDIIFSVDIILCIVKYFITLPPKIDFWYELITNGYFVIWLIYEYKIRNHYFKFKKI